MKCYICGKEVSRLGVGKHLKFNHPEVDKIEYRDNLYQIKPSDKLCKTCHRPTKWCQTQYNKYCSSKCSNSNPEKKQKYKDTMIEKYGVDNIFKTGEFKKKYRETMIERYGVAHNWNKGMRENGCEKTMIERYGVAHNWNKGMRENGCEKTMIERYGVDNPFKVKQVQEHIKEVFLDKYHVDSYIKTDEFKNKTKKWCTEIHNEDHYSKTEEFKRKCKSNWEYIRKDDEKLKKIKLIKKEADYDFVLMYWNSLSEEDRLYNSEDVQKFWMNPSRDDYRDYIPMSKLDIFNHKNYLTKKANNSFNTSKPEQELLNFFKSIYPDVKYQHKDDRYPFNCDFYIPHLDLYIEYNGSWTHGKEPFDQNNQDHIEIKSEWLKKSESSNFYRNALQTWTIRDPEKRDVAKANNLNYLELWVSDFQKIISDN